ncbi:acyl carrier protein [Streptomyces sp. M10(2022)]
MVRDAWARVLALPEASFGDQDLLSDVGGTSLKAMEILAELEQTMEVVLSPAVMRDVTVAALTDHLLSPAGEVTGRGRPLRGQAR